MGPYGKGSHQTPHSVRVDRPGEDITELMLIAPFPVPENARQNRRVPSPSTVIEPDVDELTANDRPWVVIVWNDPINLMTYVTFVLQQVFGYAREKAEKLMLEVHQLGKSVVSNGGREKCELDVFRLHEHGLWATMQHDE